MKAQALCWIADSERPGFHWLSPLQVFDAVRFVRDVRDAVVHAAVHPSTACTSRVFVGEPSARLVTQLVYVIQKQVLTDMLDLVASFPLRRLT